MTSTATPPPAATERLTELPGRLLQHADFAKVVASLAAGHGATLGGVWGSSCALVIAALAQCAPGPVVVVGPHDDDLDDLVDDLALFSQFAAARFPARESLDAERVLADEAYGDRLRQLKGLRARGEGTGVRDQRSGISVVAGLPTEPHELPAEVPRVIAASIAALLQPVPARQRLAESTRTIRVGDVLPIAELAGWLVATGMANTSAVELPGEFSLRGGIVDVFAPDWTGPVRIEFFGDEVESIRRFDAATQRSLSELREIDVTMLAPAADDREHFCNYLPPDAWFVLIEPADLEEEGRHYLERLDRPQELHSVATTLREIYRFPSVTASGVPAGSFETTCHLQIESVERFSGDIGKVRDELDSAGGGQEVFVVCQTAAEAERLQEVLGSTRLAAAGALHFPLGHLQAGFRLVAERLVLVGGNELFHRADLARPSRRRLGRAIDSFLELREGDYVVHLAHGIGRYRGLTVLEKNGQTEEHLVLEFHGETKIYVPVSKIELVQKYVGGAKSRPSLAKIGGTLWQKQKSAAQQAVADLAADMLELQAVRASRPGIAFSADTTWQQEFDASFPYQETGDQLTAIAAIKRDMQRERPMDRLLCGDVGYGKTELAMRAAFKAVDAGYQVAVLVPTTILAEQHQRTFSARMAEFPFAVRSLSRFCTAKEQQQILDGLAAGSIDVVIGTHRLAQPDVQFANLGLVVIDEEQRFGVEVKERLKALRQIVDVLTMTATPIPRTLHLSLLGVRDISNLETPPADRLAVETRVTRFDEALVRHAILRELNRGGQVYFVHNRVHDIDRVRQRLAEIVPEATVAIGHGQMPEGELEDVMLGFVRKEFDVLLATTIVESGLDIPNANTIFIDDADRYGLADLHQLRGRVGRYKHRAYCYLLVDPQRHLSPNAVRRLRAIEEFSDMGAGFAIAMRDLELRGAGNILGTQQSGHIATVGYELYCQLLEQAVRRLKHLPPRQSLDVRLDLPGAGLIPPTYVPQRRLKIDLYRRLARLDGQVALDELAAELVDRFGPRPPEVDHLLALAQLRLWAHGWGLESVHLEDSYAVLAYTERARIERLARRSGRLRIVDGATAYWPLAAAGRSPAAIFAELKALLRPQ